MTRVKLYHCNIYGHVASGLGSGILCVTVGMVSLIRRKDRSASPLNVVFA